MKEYLNEFIEKIRNGEIDLYNEFGLQFELALYLRLLPAFQKGGVYEGAKIELERPITHFKIDKTSEIPKKEIDVCIGDGNGNLISAIEIKFPTNGQVPLQLYEFCKDICFLEKLMNSNCKCAYSLVLVNSDNFYVEKREKNGIYKYFRGDKKLKGCGNIYYGRTALTGEIICPTGKKKGKSIEIINSYQIKWAELINGYSYYLIEIKKPQFK